MKLIKIINKTVPNNQTLELTKLDEKNHGSKRMKTVKIYVPIQQNFGAYFQVATMINLTAIYTVYRVFLNFSSHVSLSPFLKFFH